MFYQHYMMIEGSLEVKLLTIWTDGKAEVGRVREEKRREEKRREERRREEKRRGEERREEKRRAEERRGEKGREEKKKEDHKRESPRRKKIQVCEKGRKVAKHCVFPMICGSGPEFGGSKSRLAKAAGAEPSDQMRDEKLHAVVARSTFRSEKC